MPFSGDQNDVAWTGHLDGAKDGRFPVGFDDSLAGGGESLKNLPDDLLGVFAARIVARHYDAVGKPFDHFGHLRPLRRFPIPSAPKDRDDPASLQFGQSLEDAAQSVVGMGIVDEDMYSPFILHL